MPNTDKYHVISAETKDDLIQGVNEQILRGWQPQGGVCVTAAPATNDGPGALYFYQAMVKPVAVKVS